MPAKRGPKPPPADHPDRFTDRTRGMRRRFKPELVRTILTWLHMQEAAYRAQAASMSSSSLGVNRDITDGMARRLRSIADACGTLAADVIEPWSEYRWSQSAFVIDTTPVPAAPGEG